MKKAETCFTFLTGFFTDLVIKRQVFTYDDKSLSLLKTKVRF